jgi:uncharacterized DUF497 family protein
MRYEWDERKNRLNQRNHGGISFELAALVFEDEHRLIGLDRVDETGEERWHAIGTVSVEPGVADVLLVVHVYRHRSDNDLSPGTPREEEEDEEVIRIISARRANKNDYRRYQEQALD